MLEEVFDHEDAVLTVPAAYGTPLHARILKSKGFDPSRRHAVILDVYGGPGA